MTVFRPRRESEHIVIPSHSLSRGTRARCLRRGVESSSVLRVQTQRLDERSRQHALEGRERSLSASLWTITPQAEGRCHRDFRSQCPCSAQTRPPPVKTGPCTRCGKLTRGKKMPPPPPPQILLGTYRHRQEDYQQSFPPRLQTAWVNRSFILPFDHRCHRCSSPCVNCCFMKTTLATGGGGHSRFTQSHTQLSVK